MTGELDVPIVLADLNALAAGLGGAAAPELAGAEADELREAVRSSSLDLVTGAEDRLLHRFRAEVELEREQPLPGLPPGVRFEIQFGLSDHGAAVDVSAPVDARPFDELPTA